jgi:hypothetical protein
MAADTDLPNVPTPKTLADAIENGLMQGPVSGIRTRTHASVRDFLAQKFGAMMIKEQDEHTQAALKELWHKITGEEL